MKELLTKVRVNSIFLPVPMIRIRKPTFEMKIQLSLEIGTVSFQFFNFIEAVNLASWHTFYVYILYI